MHCEGKLKLMSHNTSYCLIDVVTKEVWLYISWFNSIIHIIVSYNYAHYFILFFKELMTTGNHRKPKALYDPLGTLFKER